MGSGNEDYLGGLRCLINAKVAKECEICGDLIDQNCEECLNLAYAIAAKSGISKEQLDAARVELVIDCHCKIASQKDN